MIERVLVGSLAMALASCTWSPPRPPALVGQPLVAPPPVEKTSSTDAPKRFDITLAPRRGSTGKVESLDVLLGLSGMPSDALLELWLAEDHEGETGWPEALSNMIGKDAAGPLHFEGTPLRRDGDAGVAWRSDRPPTGDVEIAYTVKVLSAGPYHLGGLREHAGGFQGTGSTFLPAPADEGRFLTKVRWDLTGLGEGAIGLSSFGQGIAETSGTLLRVEHAVFMAGPIGQLAIDHQTTHFHGAWLGAPAFDAGAAVKWAAEVREAEREFFRDADPNPFTFFMRVVPGIGASWVGTGRTDGFLFLAGDELTWTRPARFAIAHELIHHWIGGSDAGLRLQGPEGSAYWLTEGFTVYYTSRLMLRSGLATPNEVADDLRERTSRLALSPVKNAPNQAIIDGFWKNHDLQVLPYDRGLLYAAEVDGQLRAKSKGARGLDDLVFDLLASARAGHSDAGVSALPAATFRDRIGTELGAEGQARYDAVVTRGEDPKPLDNAFGKCIKRVEKSLHRFELGFDHASIAGKTITSLKKGSSAEKAGAREGDVIVKVSAFMGEPEHQVVMTVRRGGREALISYFPWGEKLDALIWDRDNSVPDSQCRSNKP